MQIRPSRIPLVHTAAATVTALAALVAGIPTAAAAAVYKGPCGAGSFVCGFRAAKSILGSGKGLREVIIQILSAVLQFMALAATIAIIAAGIYLIAGGATDEAKTKAKKLILYAVIGLIIILVASVFVEFVIKNVQ